MIRLLPLPYPAQGDGPGHLKAPGTLKHFAGVLSTAAARRAQRKAARLAWSGSAMVTFSLQVAPRPRQNDHARPAAPIRVTASLVS